jgi:MFS family permease
MPNTRPTDSVARLAIYVFPAVFDGVVAQILFVNTVRVARLGASAMAVAGLVTVWSIVYAACCPLIGRHVRPANAARLLILSCVGMAVISLALLISSALPVLYVLVALSGVATAFFFTPFQVFMKAVDQGGGKPLTHSAGVYTFSWSMGFAAGPFLAGLLMELDAAGGERALAGWQWADLLGAAASLLTGIAVLRLRHLAATPAAAAIASHTPATPAAAADTDYRGYPDFAWLALLGAAAGFLAMTLIRGVFPVRAVAQLHLSDATQGTFFFLLSAALGVTALALTRGRTWMYRPGPALTFGACGTLGTLLIGWGFTPAHLYAGAILFGLCLGGLCFGLVFHAIVDPVHSARNVARNELVVGLSGIAGPALGGLLGDAVSLQAPYLVAAILLAAFALLQTLVLSRTAAPAQRAAGD